MLLDENLLQLIGAVGRLLAALTAQLSVSTVNECIGLHVAHADKLPLETVTLPVTRFFLPRDAMLARYMPSSCVRLSARFCLSVRHTPVLYQNG